MITNHILKHINLNQFLFNIDDTTIEYLGIKHIKSLLIIYISMIIKFKKIGFKSNNSFIKILHNLIKLSLDKEAFYKTIKNS